MYLKEQIKALKDDEGMLTGDKSEIDDIFNNHFESMFIKEPPVQLPELKIGQLNFENTLTDNTLTGINLAGKNSKLVEIRKHYPHF